jgi:hypothetical protein
MDKPERRGGQHVGQGAGGAGAGHLGLELVLADRNQLDLDVGLLLEPVDDRLGGLDPVGVVLGGPEGKAAVVVVLAAPTAAANGDDEERGQ